MNRLTTDNPQNNFETMMNLVYAKDEWHHIRHGDMDMKTTDFCLELCKARECEYFEKCDTDEAKDECLCSCLFDGCPIATVYAALCGYGHTRSRLKMYEDMGMEPKWIDVKERLPEPDEEVLLIAHGWKGRLLYLGCLHHTNVEKSWLTGITSAESEWCIRGWSYLKVPLVTHWMPLPNLPKEDCNG